MYHITGLKYWRLNCINLLPYFRVHAWDHPGNYSGGRRRCRVALPSKKRIWIDCGTVPCWWLYLEVVFKQFASCILQVSSVGKWLRTWHSNWYLAITERGHVDGWPELQLSDIWRDQFGTKCNGTIGGHLKWVFLTFSLICLFSLWSLLMVHPDLNSLFGLVSHWLINANYRSRHVIKSWGYTLVADHYHFSFTLCGLK